MAFRATSYWRAMVSLMGGNRTMATSTAPKMKPFAQILDAHTHTAHQSKSKVLKGDFVPVYVTLGMVLLAMSIAIHTAKQQLVYSPGVYVSKKKRETLPEVVDPDHVVEDADKFIKKSFFRKVAHIQEFDTDIIPNPVKGDPLSMAPVAETLKSVGVDPSHV